MKAGELIFFLVAGGVILPEFIFRGVDPSGNLYYYDYFRLPSLYHKRGFPVPASLVPVQMLDHLEASGGGFDSTVGPGYGGLVCFNTPDQLPQDRIYEIWTSISNAGFYVEQPVNESFGVYASVNKSLYEFTFLPMISYLSENEIDPFTKEFQKWRCGDFDSSLKILWFPADSQIISIDFLGLYDFDTSTPNWDYFNNYDPRPYLDPHFMYDEPGTHSSISQYEEFENDYNVHSQGAEWSLFTDNFYNEAHIAHSLLISDDEGVACDYDAFQEKFVESRLWVDLCYVHQVQTGDNFEFRIPFGLAVQMGGEYSLFQMTAAHHLKLTDFEEVPSSTLNETPITGKGIISNSQKGLDGELVISEEEYIHTILKFDPSGLHMEEDGSLSARTYELNSYINLIQNIGLFSFFFGPRIDYFDYFEDYYLSLRGGMAITPYENLNIILSGGTYPGSLDYLTITRGVYLESEEIFIPTKISEAYSGNLDINWAFHEKAELNAAVYYSRLYNLSGASVLLDAKSPSEGENWGVEFDFMNSPWSFLDWQLHYTYARSKYLVGSEGWLSPDSEIYHTLVWQNYLKPFSFLSIGSNIKLFSGRKFTPFIVVKSTDGNGLEADWGGYNSAIDYIPAFGIDLSLKFHWHSKKSDKEINLDITDFYRGYTDYSKLSFLGQDTSKASDRVYVVRSSIDLEYLPAINFGMKFSF